MNLDLPQLWALHGPHYYGLVAIRDALAEGVRASAPELEALLGIGALSSATLARQGKIAIVPLHGVLTMRPLFGARWGSLPNFTAQMKEAAAHRDVTHIVIDVDSPGGETAGVEEAHALVSEIKKRKRVTAHVNSLAASGAYWIASATSEIALTPSGHSGGLGVIAHHVDASGALLQHGITATVVSAPAGKRDASGLTPLSDDGHRNLERLVSDRYAAMLRDISRGRKLSHKLVEESFGQGRLLTAKMALPARMVDRVEPFDETLERVSGVPRSKGRLSERGQAMQATYAVRAKVAHLESVGRAQDERLRPLIEAWEQKHDPRVRLAELQAMEEA